MSGVNKVILIGNLGKKPELTYTASGIPICKFSIATTERMGKDESGQAKEHTEWHLIVAWRQLAEICQQYLDKGSKIYCEGKIRTSSWTTPEGEKKYKTEIHMDQMQMLSPRGQSSGEAMGDGGPNYEEYGGSGGGDRGGGAFRKESGSFPGNGAKPAGRTATAAQPEVINLDKLDDNDFF
ncbi:MAG: single-stranded DNA-binding protein [bacterium]